METYSKTKYNSLLDCIFSNISDMYMNGNENEKIQILNSAYEYFEKNDKFKIICRQGVT